MTPLSMRVISHFLRTILHFFRAISFYSLVKFLKNSLSLTTFPYLNINRVSTGDLRQIIDSEYFDYFRSKGSASKLPRSYFRREWTRFAWMAMEGEYHKANLGRANLILEARSVHGLDEDFVPTTLEKGWTTHYGHLGCLINFRNAQELGVVGLGRRLVLRSNHYYINRPIYRLLRNNFDFMNSVSKNSIFDTEPFFHFTEKVPFISTNMGFKELAEFFNLVSEKQIQRQNFKRENFQFIDQELVAVERLFREHGYSHEQPFVAIHIRETQDKYSARDSVASNFVPAIQEIIKTGRVAIRIGSPNSSRRPSIPGLIDLRGAVSAEEQFLHDFVISRCDYLISSQSGPTAVAHALGVPTLIVDGVAIARYSYSTPALSMTLPKPWLNSKGQKLSYENVLRLGLGFCELATSQKKFYLQNNSGNEILSAVREFSSLLSNATTARKNPSGFQEMKKSIGGIGEGLISEVYFS